MARLVIRTEGFGEQLVLLKWGVNSFGRTPGNDFCIEHPTISSRHCEIHAGDKGLLLRDCNSTNGTFVDGREVTEPTPLQAGQVLRLGEVELHVEETEIRVAIPEVDFSDRPVPPIVQVDGAVMCRRHETHPAVYKCTHCLEMLCEDCVRKLRRRRGKTLFLCARCSFPCTYFGPERKKRKGVVDFLFKTIKLPFARTTKR